MPDESYIGKKFGKLTIIAYSHHDSRKRRWYKCKCDCGNDVVVLIYRLRNGHTKSCGCLQKVTNKKHGLSRTREYQIWADMKGRCLNKRNRNYDYYGGRGISFCKEWESFEVFLEDMGKCPNGFQLDRINVNGNYCKSNCKWSSRQEQMSNTRRNRYINYNDSKYTISSFSKAFNLCIETTRKRINQGWTAIKILKHYGRL